MKPSDFTCTDVFLRYPALWLISYMHHIGTDTTYYERTDVTSRRPTPLIKGCTWFLIIQICEWHPTHTSHENGHSLYECIHVPSRKKAPWMIFYTHHKNMDAHNYECLDIPSDNSSTWMIYYTLYRNVGILHHDIVPYHIHVWMMT
jgi:hypothetical protein